MSDQQLNRGDPGNSQEGWSTTGMPRWVKVFLIVAIAVAALAVMAMLVVGGDHGPGRHQFMISTIDPAPQPSVAPFMSRDSG